MASICGWCKTPASSGKAATWAVPFLRCSELCDTEYQRNNQPKRETRIMSNGKMKADPEAQVPEFEVGDFVYIDNSTSIGQVSSRCPKEEGGYGYRVNYCQGKDLATGPRGGNGPVNSRGYPKPVTEAADVVFVKALGLKQKIAELTKILDGLHIDYNAFVHVRNIMSPPPPPKTKKPSLDIDDEDYEDE